MAFLGIMFVTAASWGANYGTSLLMPRSLERMGLQRQWRTHVMVDSAKGGIANVVPFASLTQSRSVFEVTSEQGNVQRFPQDQWSHLEPLAAQAEAKRHADIAARVFESLGKSATITEITIPEVSLHVATDRGRVQVFNATSGRTIWSADIGDPNYPMLAPGASETFVSAINGSTLYVFDRKTAKLVWKRALSGLPVAGPAVTDEHVFVPLRGGAVETFDMEKSMYLPSTRLMSSAVCVGKPSASAETISWATESGHVYVSRLSDFRSQFRFETGSPIVQGIAHGPQRAIVVATEDGHVYSFGELSKKTNWFYFAGEAFVQAPLVIGDAIYALTDQKVLARLEANTGTLQWQSIGVCQIVSASSSRVYVLDTIGRLASIDANSGQLLAAAAVGELDLFVENTITDRLYVGTYSGQLICLRQTDLLWPEVHTPTATSMDSAGASEESSVDATIAEQSDNVDPFAEEDDPFAEETEEETDPFGEEDDPFLEDFADPFK